MNHLISFEEYTNESMQGFNNKYLEKIKAAVRGLGVASSIYLLGHIEYLSKGGIAILGIAGILNAILLGNSIEEIKKDNRIRDLIRDMNVNEYDFWEILHRLKEDKIALKMIKRIENSDGLEYPKAVKEFEDYLYVKYKMRPKE